MHKIYPSDNREMSLVITIKCNGKKRFRVWAEEYQRINSKYADRIVFGSVGCDAGPINAEMYRLNWRWYETDDEYFDVANAHHYQGRWMVYGVNLPDEVL